MPQEGKADIQAALLTYPWMFLTSGSLTEGASHSVGGGSPHKLTFLEIPLQIRQRRVSYLIPEAIKSTIQVDNPTFTPRFYIRHMQKPSTQE